MLPNLMHVKLTRDQLVGDRTEPKGKVLALQSKRAEAMVKSGAAIHVAPPPIESAADPRPTAAERAVAPRGR